MAYHSEFQTTPASFAKIPQVPSMKEMPTNSLQGKPRVISQKGFRGGLCSHDSFNITDQSSSSISSSIPRNLANSPFSYAPTVSEENIKTKEHKLIKLPDAHKDASPVHREIKILFAFSGLKQALTMNPGYNHCVDECLEAAALLLKAIGDHKLEPDLSNGEALLCNVPREAYDVPKRMLEPDLAKRMEHYFSENTRVLKGFKVWASGRLDELGKLISASGASSIDNNEYGADPLIQKYRILLRAPGVLGSRFSRAGFRGCCLALVYAEKAKEATSYVRIEYSKCQPLLSRHLNPDTAVLICEAGNGAGVI